jgi:diaminopropionate ammonia-lyase
MNDYLLNPAARRYPRQSSFLTEQEQSSVQTFFSSHQQFSPTPLRHLTSLAAELEIGDILLKDESERAGLDSFKILGVAYAVGRLLELGKLARGSILVCASEGNHGRAVARVGAENGFKVKVYVAADTSQARIDAIRHEQAEVIPVAGNYDDAVRIAAQNAAEHGWQVISDTSWPGYEEVPALIMTGYAQLMNEAEVQWSPGPAPDVVIVQAGVGSFAASVAGWLRERYGANGPFLVVCEPTSAASLMESFRAGKMMSLPGPFDTMAAGLRCGVVSALAWREISQLADAFVAIDDEYLARAVRLLAFPRGRDPKVTSGPSGASGLGGLLAIVRDSSLKKVRQMLRLDQTSRVFVINTEGATDAQLYKRIVEQTDSEQ